MSWNPRRVLFVLLVLIGGVSTVCLDQGRAQDKAKGIEVKAAPIAKMATRPAEPRPDNPDGFLNGGISLPKDEKRRNKAIEAAVDYIEKEEWAVAIPHLQKLLEIDEDVFVRLTRKSADGKEVSAWVSVKREADRLIGTLPPAGKDFYKLSFGGKAADMLKKAKKNGDPALLAEIMKRYAHTDAGGEAIKLLADYHLDRGNYIAAILCFDKLFGREGADKLPPVVLFKAAYAAHMAPASATASEGTQLAASKINEKELWKQLRSQGRDVQLGPDESRPVAELEEYVSKLERANFVQNATDAIVFRATPDRSNQLVGGPAFMSATWRHSMMYDEGDSAAAQGRLKHFREQLKNTNQPIIPAFAPITVTVSKGEERTPLLIYKNYWGIVARNLKKNGEIAWASPSSWSLEKLLHPKAESGKSQPMNQWLDFYQSLQPEIAFENSTVGTLSTDGKFVYVVEDLAVPPPPQVLNVNMGWPGNNPNAFRPEVQDAINHSRLQAFELKTNGKLVWELGGEEKGPLSDCYFLGPPLPLGGKLYLLVEKQQEVRLICLETTEVPTEHGPMPGTRIVSTQTLGTTQEKMQNDVLRRTNAAHLAYGEGILVCPTNAGAVFGINLLENSLVWAYPYREKSDQAAQAQMGQQFMGRGGRVFIAGGGMGMNMPAGGTHPNHNQWKASAPVVADGKVVFTAPDARSIHCVNLRDGSPVWRKPKLDDDLYLGNVYNGKVLIVGKKNVRGLSLNTGETLWVLETGVPSGQGIGSDNVYYLPLKQAGRAKEPQICAIDVDRGRIVGSSKSRPRIDRDNQPDVPGNLLFYEGDVISLTDEEVVVYPQLKVKIAQMDELIAKNPNDPVGLTERGDLRLDKGDLTGAIEDLSLALKNKPDKKTRDRARGKLYDTLTAYIADHFNDAEKYLKEYEELCRVDMEGAEPDKRKELEAEQRRRRATFLWLVGKGREEQGRLVEAFEKYQQFGAEAGKQSELVPAVDERQVKAAPDVWSRGRIIAMMARAKPEHRAPLEKLIAGKWEKLRDSNDLNELRQFVRMFGSASAAGKEARLQLAERLMEQQDGAEEHPLLEAELELNQFRTGEQTPELAARATEALARLYTRKGLLEDAAYCYRKLGHDFAKVRVRDGKTGLDFFNDTATDKRLLPYLDEPDPFGSIKLKTKRDESSFQIPDRGQLFQFEHSGEDLPFFRKHIVGLSFANHEFRLLDRYESEGNAPFREVWSHKLPQTMLQMLTLQVFGYQVNQFNRAGMMVNAGNQNVGARFPYRTMGHLIVLPACDMLFGIDPVNRRVLWEKRLAPEKGAISTNAFSPQQQNTTQPAVDPRDGSVIVTYPGTNWSQRLGEAGPLEGQAVYVQVQDTLTALDPLTGRTLWSRMDVNPRNYVFADDRHVFVVEMDAENKAHATRVFRAADGISVKEAPDFHTLFEKRLQLVGRHILVGEAGPGSTVQVRLYDPLTGENLWKQTYPARSLVARSEEPGFTAVVEPDGKVHFIDLKARKEVSVGQLAEPAKDLLNVQVVHLLADCTNFYLAFQAPMEIQNGNVRFVGGNGVQSNVMTQLGMRTVPVNGMLYAFRKAGGEPEWYVEAKNQMLVLDQFRELPVVFLTARRQEIRQVGGGIRGGGRVAFPVSILSIQKWNGAVVSPPESDIPQNLSNFYGVRIDARARTIDFLSQNMKFTHFPDPKKNKEAAPPADAPARRGSQAPPARPATAEEKVKRARIERLRIREIGNPLTPP